MSGFGAARFRYSGEPPRSLDVPFGREDVPDLVRRAVTGIPHLSILDLDEDEAFLVFVQGVVPLAGRVKLRFSTIAPRVTRIDGNYRSDYSVIPTDSLELRAVLDAIQATVGATPPDSP